MTEISREYAEALFELAMENGNVKEVSEGLKFVTKLFEDYKEYYTFLTSPGISKKERLESIEKTLSGEVPECLVAFVSYMCQRNKLKYYAGAALEFEKLYSDSMNVATVFVKSAVPLNEDEKTRLKEKLEKRYGRSVLISWSVDGSLIGGIRLETDGYIIDGSVKRRLQELKEVIDK